MLCDRLVCGIAHRQIQWRLLAESKLTLKRATGLALGTEAAVKNAQILQSTPLRAIAQDGSLHKVQMQMEKKGLACVFGVKWFHSYLYSCKFS